MKRFFLLLALLFGISGIIEAGFSLYQNNPLFLVSVLTTSLSGYGWYLVAKLWEENEWLHREMRRIEREKE